MSRFHPRRMDPDRSSGPADRPALGVSAGESRYIAMAMTGLNDPAKAPKPVDECALSFRSFAEAKADAVGRAEKLREHFDSAGYEYRVHSESADHYYEVAFEYGPRSADQTPRLKMVFHVYRCTVTNGEGPGCGSIPPVRDL